ncbi:MAG: polysaccharide biosynthesis tyrosine autokinase [Nevskiales bacterium]
MTEQQGAVTDSVPSEVEGGLDLRSLLADVLDHWPLLLAVSLLATLIGLYRAWVATPLFRAEALVQIEMLSSGSTLSDTMNPYPYPRFGESVETQLEILRSRSVLGEAVKAQHLDLVAEPIYYSNWGRALARGRAGRTQPAGPPLGLGWLGRYAWGGERIRVSQFQAPDAIRGRPFLLRAGNTGTYSLHQADGAEVLRGMVGEEASTTLSEGNELKIFVAELNARPGTEFSVVQLPVNVAANQLLARLVLAERGDRTGVVTVGITNTRPDVAAAIANAVAHTFLLQNVERLSQEASNKLEFLNTQLPRLKSEVQTAEQALLDHRTRSGMYELSDAARSLLDASTVIEKTLSEIDLQQAELSQIYTAQHPQVMAAGQKRRQLLADKAALDQRLQSIPGKEGRLLQLTRDSEVANQLYLMLLNKAQELKVAKAGTVGNVRIIDEALPPAVAAYPDKRQILRAWAVFGLIGGVLLCIALARIRSYLRSAEEIERKTGLPVFSVIPHSANQRRLSAKENKGQRVLAWTHQMDPAVESFRSLRASLHFAQMNATNNIVTVTGPTPAVGKSFVALNLAAVVADAGRKVLLVDADMRKGRLHETLGVPRSPGLSELVSGQCERAAAVRDLGKPGFHVITSGQQPPNPTELLSAAQFKDVLAWASKSYDVVIVDTAPIMNLADGILVSRQSGAVFLVVREHKTTYSEIRSSVKRLLQVGVKVDGLIFNGLASRLSSYVRDYGRYGQYRGYYGKTSGGGEPQKSNA